MVSLQAVKEGKKVAKVLMAESKSEQAAIQGAIGELADIQKMQKDAIQVRSTRSFSVSSS